VLNRICAPCEGVDCSRYGGEDGYEICGGEESQLSVMPAKRGTLLPFSKARRRALSHVNVTHNPGPGRLAAHILQSANSVA
jgi:hypothetical protein